MLSKDQPVSDAFSVICPFGSFFLTKTGGLIGAIELGGCDPDALTQQDAVNLSMLSRVVYGALPANFTVNEYYLQAARAPIRLRDRSDPLSHRLSQARQAALRERGLARSQIVHVLHARDPHGWNGELGSTILKNLPFFFLSRESRNIVKARLRTPNALVLREAELSARSATLQKALSDAAAKWSLAMTSRVLPLEALWKFLRFCATLDSRFVDPDFPVPVPDDDADCALQAGDIEPVRLGYEDALKLHGRETRYLRIASLYKMPKNPVGLFARQPDPLISRRGSFVLQNQYTPVTEFQRSFKFKGARTRIDRTMLDLRALFLGYEPTHPGEQRLAVRQKIEELERAEAVAESWATSFSQLIVFDEDPARLKKTVSTFDNLLTTKGVSLVWEAPALPMAFQAFQPGGEGHSIRNSTVTTSRAAALSLVYRAHSGIETVEALGGEEPQYFFETETGELFSFSAYIGGRALIIAVGPIRSGKTFAKNTMTAHFLKYGGMSRSIDIDPGTETLAKLFGEDGGLFRVGDGVVRGLNPFVGARGPDDRAFAAHMSALALQLLEVNDTEAGRGFTATEQAEFDRALQSVLRLPPEMQSLPHLIDHFPGPLQKKFGRWVGDGTYAGIFDASEDGIGALNKRVGVFNLQAFRDDPKVLKPLLLEIFYRVTAEFEGQANRRLPKLLEIDEAHHALSLPSFRDFIVRKVRTWGKFGAGITLWSQSANDYLRTPDWDAIRGAATTFLFFADPRMDAALYKEAFHLSDGQCEAIRNLVPKRELFLVQPEIGVAKKLVLTVEPEQYVVNTSDPHEAALRDELIARHGFEEGLRLAVEQIHRANHLMAAE